MIMLEKKRTGPTRKKTWILRWKWTSMISRTRSEMALLTETRQLISWKICSKHVSNTTSRTERHKF